MRRVVQYPGILGTHNGIELTRSELIALLTKLDVPKSVKILHHRDHGLDNDGSFFVRAVEDDAHGEDTLDRWWDGANIVTIPLSACEWSDDTGTGVCSMPKGHAGLHRGAFDE